MRREKFIVLLLMVALFVAPTVVWQIFKGDGITFDPIFNLPQNTPYLYFEFDESVLDSTKKGRFVFFLSNSEQFIQPIDDPSSRNHFGKIFASMSEVSLKGEIFSVGDNEWEMKFSISNLDSALPRAFTDGISPVSPRNFPNIEGTIYGNVAMAHPRGQLYATMTSGAARWKGVEIPAVLAHLYIGKRDEITKIFRELHDKLQNEHEFTSSHGGFYAPAPTTLWLTEAKEFVEVGIMDENCVIGSASQSPMNERALFWAQIFPSPLAAAVDRALLQIKPGISIRKSLNGIEKIERLTISIKSLKSGTLRWKVK